MGEGDKMGRSESHTGTRNALTDLKMKRSIPIHSRSSTIVDAVGKIGIFWWHNGRVLSAISPVAEGTAVNGIVDSAFAHVDTWPNLQKRHRELRDLEYEDVPRGRVLFLQRQNKFRVLLDKKLLEPAIKAAICQTFGLPKAGTEFEFKTDSHYTTDPVAIARLLDE